LFGLGLLLAAVGNRHSLRADLALLGRFMN